jgi:hypothetical protein
MGILVVLVNYLAVLINGFILFLHVYTGNVSWLTYITGVFVVLNFFVGTLCLFRLMDRLR